jgi:hypothetical protein
LEHSVPSFEKAKETAVSYLASFAFKSSVFYFSNRSAEARKAQRNSRSEFDEIHHAHIPATKTLRFL